MGLNSSRCLAGQGRSRKRREEESAGVEPAYTKDCNNSPPASDQICKLDHEQVDESEPKKDVASSTPPPPAHKPVNKQSSLDKLRRRWSERSERLKVNYGRL